MKIPVKRLCSTKYNDVECGVLIEILESCEVDRDTVGYKINRQDDVMFVVVAGGELTYQYINNNPNVRCINAELVIV